MDPESLGYRPKISRHSINGEAEELRMSEHERFTIVFEYVVKKLRNVIFLSIFLSDLVPHLNKLLFIVVIMPPSVDPSDLNLHVFKLETFDLLLRSLNQVLHRHRRYL